MKVFKKLSSIFMALVMIATISSFANVEAFAKTKKIKGVEYTYSIKNNQVTITDIYFNDDDDDDNDVKSSLSIPSKIDGAKVTSIGGKWYLYVMDVKKLIIPDTVVNVKVYMGENSTIELGKNVKNFYAYNNSSLNIKVDSKNKYYSVKNGVLYNKKKTKLIAAYKTTKKSFTVPSTVKTIEPLAFSNSKYTSITCPKSVVEMGYGVFAYSENLSKVDLSKTSIKEISENLFAFNVKSIALPAGLKKITSEGAMFNANKITISSKNKYFKVSKGVLYNKKMTKLVKYPVGAKAKSFNVPSTVTSIGSYAFLGANNLKKITLPKKLTSIGAYAFSYCTNLSTCKLTDKIKSIGSGAFIHTKIKSVNAPKTLTSIGYSSFSDCESLKSVDLSKSKVKAIPKSAFENSSELEGVKIPKTVTKIDNSAFSNCSDLENITVSKSNKTFASKSGVLYDKKIQTLIMYPMGKDNESFSVPSTVKTINAYSCASAEFEKLTLPSGLKTIKEAAFFNNELDSVIIPASVESVAQMAFCSYNDNSITITVKGKNTKLSNGFCNSYDSVIKGYKGSTAEKYAANHYVEFEEI